MPAPTLVELLYALEEGRSLRKAGFGQAALTTEQLCAVLREAFSIEPNPQAISTMFGSAFERKASPPPSAAPKPSPSKS
jgi:hypothetical protein